MAESKPTTTYRDAGVDIEAGDALVERIKPAVKRSMRPEVMGGIGGFGALVEVPLDRIFLCEEQLCETLDACLAVSNYVLERAPAWLDED